MASKIGNMTAMYNPPHPGMLLDDYLGDISLTEAERNPNGTRAEAARRLGVTRATLSRIRHGRSAVNAEMAMRLSLLLGATPELWLGMQSAYDLWIERQNHGPMCCHWLGS